MRERLKIPEIVEVQVQVDGLQLVVGEKIQTIEIKDRANVLLSHYPNHFRDALVGHIVNKVWRTGKYIIFELREPKGASKDVQYLYLLVHLGMSGAFLINTEHRHERVIFNLSRTTLTYKDMRYFGNLKIFTAPELVRYIESRKLGVDALTSNKYEIEMALIKKIYERKNANKPIKQLLLDQTIISGLGNIYANEVLFEAGIHPLKTPSELGFADLKEIAKHVESILKLSYQVGGSSVKDFTGTGEEIGKFSDYMKVYGRKNKPCMDCNTIIQTVKVEGRSSFYCPTCQRWE